MVATDETLTEHEEEKIVRKSGEEMDEQRQKTLAYEYLCHLEEAKKWMENCLRESLPPTTELEENLRNGVYLAKLGHFMAPDSLPLNRIYDIEQRRYKVAGLQFRHTDNINHFLKCLKYMQLPLIFQPETTDIYDKKNMPRVIYCIHALSTHLFKLGKAPQIQDLYGKIIFTDEEIDVVSKELKKYGVQMPSFQKIGGLLINNTDINDVAALHAAVFAINQAITTNDNVKVLYTLHSKTAQLNNVMAVYVKEYTEALLKAKTEKIEATSNKSLNESYVADAYDELLTQAEIQGHINYVNTQCALETITKSVYCPDIELINALKISTLSFKNVSFENAEIYKEQLIQIFESDEWDKIYSKGIHHWQDLLQNAINKANKIAQQSQQREENVKSLNMALQFANKEMFYQTLQSPYLGLSDYIDEFAFPLYYEEMKEDWAASQANLNYDDIVVSIRVLSLIAAVSKAVDTGNPDFIYEKLSHPEAQISDLDEENKVKYTDALAIARREKQLNECPLLTYADIQESIDLINMQCNKDAEAIQDLRQLNSAVMQNDQTNMMKALKTIKSDMCISSNNAVLYLKLFRKCLLEDHSDGSELWLNDIETIVRKVASEVEEIESIYMFLKRINKAVEENNVSIVIKCLETFGFTLPKKYKEKCFLSLQQLRKQKCKIYISPYISYITDKGNEVHIELETHTILWDCSKDADKTYQLTMKDIKETIQSIIPEDRQKNNYTTLEELIIELQPYIHGYLLRRKFADKLLYIFNMKRIIKIQAWWKGVKQRKKYHELLKEREKQKALLYTDKLLNTKTSHDDDILSRYNNIEDKIIKIQALWRGRTSRKAFHSLLHSEKPAFPVVRRFSTILGFNAEDYDKDLKLQKLKHEVVQSIKNNQNLSQQLNSMYIKIGLLIQNRVALQDVLAYSKSLDTFANEKNVSIDGLTVTSKGLKSLTKEGRKMLEGYQHLFYALQTNPQYLGKLLHLPPQAKPKQLFLKNVILTLFNFGSNTREDYLLLKLFDYALKEEIKYNCNKPSEVLIGKPLVREMAVNFARQSSGPRSLKQLLQPLIEKVLKYNNLYIDTNPVGIYKFWRIQVEMKFGQPQDFPREVTPEQALSHAYVREKFKTTIRILKNLVVEFLDRITNSRDLIPYGMLYMAKVLYNSLMEKFPEAPEKDILKAVGNLIYYHFINAAIVAPDTFDIITLPVDEPSLANIHRRNLGTIAKILNFAASKKGFGEETPYLKCLNQFIIDCHEKLKTFFRYCCQVEDLEEHFNIHEYTEATRIENPRVYTSLQEICDIHSLILEYQERIAPDQSDPLYDLLDDLGPKPTVASLFGISDETYKANLARYSKTEVCLVLNNKFQVPHNDTILSNLFIKTKELLVSVIPFLKRQTLVESLENTSSPMHVKLFDYQYSAVSPALNIIRESSFINDCKLQLRSYLHKLELEGWVNRADGYQTIVTAIAKDICNKRKYRAIRNKELQTLCATKEQLNQKTKYYQEQLETYNQYIHRCLENLHTEKSSLRAFFKTTQKSTHKKLKSKMTFKYSASKLQEKGVLLEIDGLSQTEFKNVIFEISPTERSGIFLVLCKFMGVEMEKLNISIQELLELQYEGVSIMDMFGKAKINVNLLLYLLNRKYYSKT